MSRYISPMSGGQDCKVQPGPVKGGACPPPSEIVVIETRKVFDFCFQEDLIERCFLVPGLGSHGTVRGCEIVAVDCCEMQEREFCDDKKKGLALVSIQINMTLKIMLIPEPRHPPQVVTRHISFPKRVVLCAPHGTDVTCDVRGTCICTMQPMSGQSIEPNLCCTLQLCTVVTSTAGVKLLVPSFGVVMPKECPPAISCPPFSPDPCREC